MKHIRIILKVVYLKDEGNDAGGHGRGGRGPGVTRRATTVYVCRHNFPLSLPKN